MSIAAINSSISLSSITAEAVIPLKQLKIIRKINNFHAENIESALNKLSEFLEEQLDEEKVFFITIIIDERFDPLISEQAELLESICHHRPIVIYFKAKNDRHLSIIWKSKDIPYFLILRYPADDGEFDKNGRKIHDFLAEYLATSLSREEIGKNFFIYFFK